MNAEDAQLQFIHRVLPYFHLISEVCKLLKRYVYEVLPFMKVNLNDVCTMVKTRESLQLDTNARTLWYKIFDFNSSGFGIIWHLQI